MAARYWVNGTGNWNDINHWSTISGGVGGASVPTMNDDVYFDSNSGTGTITVNTIANMRDCTFAQTQLITLTNAAYAFNIFGNWTLCSDTYLNTSFTGTGYMYLKATTSVNITSNGCTSNWNRLYFDGVDGTWILQDDWNGRINVWLVNGTLNTNSKTANFNEWRLGQGIKTLITGASLLKSSNGFMWRVGNTGFSFNKDSCTIEVSGGGWAEFGGNVLNDLYLTYSGDGSSATVGGFICNNLYIQPYSDNSINTTVFGANSVIINNGLYIIGRNSSNYRHLISSNTIGVPRTITCNGTITASNVDFRDIVGAGTANWDLSNITGGSGDCGGNSGITFTPAQTQYFKHTLGAVNWSDVTKWFSNYERTIQGRVPLPQDDAIFDENSFTGASTLTMNVSRIGELNMNGVNQAITLARSVAVEVYGNFILCNGIAMGLDNGYFFRMYSKATNSDAILDFKTLNYNEQLHFIRGTFQFASNISSKIFINSALATIYTNNYTLNVGTYLISTAKMYAGNSIIQFNGNSNSSFLTVNLNSNFIAENSTLKFVKTGTQTVRMAFVSLQLNKLWLAGTHTGNYEFEANSNNTFNELIIDAGRKLTILSGTTQTIGKLTAIGTPDRPITIGSTTADTFNLVKTGSEPNECNFIDISNSNASPSGSWSAGYNSNDMGNNTGWEFNTDDFVPQIINV